MIYNCVCYSHISGPRGHFDTPCLPQNELTQKCVDANTVCRQQFCICEQNTIEKNHGCSEYLNTNYKTIFENVCIRLTSPGRRPANTVH